MTEQQKTPLILGAFFLGVVLGSVGTFLYFKTRTVSSQPTIPLSGTVTLDTASYPNLYLNNAIYLDNPTVSDRRIYLDFQDDATMNEALGKTVTVVGTLQTVDIGDGEEVTEMDVLRIEPIE